MASILRRKSSCVESISRKRTSYAAPDPNLVISTLGIPDTAAILHHHTITKYICICVVIKGEPQGKCGVIGSSNPHRHYDVAVAILLIGKWAHLAGALFVFQFNADRAFRRGRKKIQNVAGIESNRNWIAFVILLNNFFCFAIFRDRR